MAPSKKGVYVGRQLEIHGPTEWPGQEDDPKVAGKVTEYQEESKGRIERYRVLCPDGWHEWVPVEFVEKYLIKDIEDPNSSDNITADEDTDGTGASQLKSSSDNLGDEGAREGEDGDSGQEVPPTDLEDENAGLPPRRSMRLSPKKPENCRSLQRRRNLRARNVWSSRTLKKTSRQARAMLWATNPARVRAFGLLARAFGLCPSVQVCTSPT